MEKQPSDKKGVLKELQNTLKTLQVELSAAQKKEGIDEYITVAVGDKQAHFERIKTKGQDDKAIGKFLLEIVVTAKNETVYVPLSIASGKKPTGFMYQIEGTAEGTILSTAVKCRGDKVTQVTLGTLLYVKIPARETASFRILISIRGKFGKKYNIRIVRINYKLQLTDARYQQYLRELVSDYATFS